MSNYEIKIQVDISKTEKEVTQGAHQSADGSFGIVVSGASGQSIDQCEQALLATNYPAIREALSRHFSEVSKQEADSYHVGMLKKTPRRMRSMEK
ncbi:MAG: hypothetical protein ACE5IY_21925 [bacterium]